MWGMRRLRKWDGTRIRIYVPQARSGRPRLTGEIKSAAHCNPVRIRGVVHAKEAISSGICRSRRVSWGLRTGSELRVSWTRTGMRNG